MGISDPRRNVDATGRAVLSIWNPRVDAAMGEYDDLRVAGLLRNMDTREFVLFEDEVGRYIPKNYKWGVNKGKNLEGCDKKTGAREFTWPPHGSQFTIHRRVPPAARKFCIAREVPIIEYRQILNLAEYHSDWIQFID